MSRAQLLLAVRETVASTFGAPLEDIDADTTALDVDGWDSLGHTVMLVRLGKRIGRNIPDSIGASAQCVGDLVDRLCDLLNTDTHGGC